MGCACMLLMLHDRHTIRCVWSHVSSGQASESMDGQEERLFSCSTAHSVSADIAWPDLYQACLARGEHAFASAHADQCCIQRSNHERLLPFAICPAVLLWTAQHRPPAQLVLIQQVYLADHIA